MTIQQTRQFVCAARAGSILKASEELHISHQALGQSLHNLEAELGAPLFRRAVGGMNLTGFGCRILPIAESMLKSYDGYIGLIEAQKGRSRAAIRITLEHDLAARMIPPELTILEESVQVILVDGRGGVRNCIADVLDGSAELAVVSRGGGAGGLEYIPVICGALVVLMRKDHPLARKKTLSIGDLRDVAQNWPALMNHSVASGVFDACIREGFFPNIVFEAPNFDMILSTILSRNLVNLAPPFMACGFLPGEITARPLLHDTLKAELGFLVSGQGRERPLVRSFINAVLDHYSRSPARRK
jgi:DNA-binding transcriptional LysR family regulator